MLLLLDRSIPRKMQRWSDEEEDFKLMEDIPRMLLAEFYATRTEPGTVKDDVTNIKGIG
jgi:hypothetical protein